MIVSHYDDDRMSRVVPELPFDSPQFQPASIDLRLDNEFAALDSLSIAGSYYTDPPIIDPEKADEVHYIRHYLGNDEPYVLRPGGFVLASTVELVDFPKDLAGQVIDKSSLARLGLALHAGFIDPGFRGHITLEITNHAALPFKLWPGMLIGQLVLFTMSSSAGKSYGEEGFENRYQDQTRGPVVSRSNQNFVKGIEW